MPSIRNQRINGAKEIHDLKVVNGMVGLTYAQASKLPARLVYLWLDKSDKGWKGRVACHWWRYFAKPMSVLSCKHSTKLMVETASKKLEKQLFDSLPCC